MSFLSSTDLHDAAPAAATGAQGLFVPFDLALLSQPTVRARGISSAKAGQALLDSQLLRERLRNAVGYPRADPARFHIPVPSGDTPR